MNYEQNPENRTNTSYLLAVLAMVSISYFVVVMATLHFLRTDHNPIKQTTSQYVVGPYGFLMTTAFFSISLASFALVAGLYQAIPAPVRPRTALIFLGIWAVAVLISMIFPINLDGTPLTTAAIIHRISGPVAFISLTTGAILLSRNFEQAENFRSIHRPALMLSWLMLPAFILTFVNIATEAGFAGISQRILLSIFVIWFYLVVVRLYAIARKDKNEPE